MLRVETISKLGSSTFIVGKQRSSISVRRGATADISRGQCPRQHQARRIRPGRDGGKACETKPIPASFQDARFYRCPSRHGVPG